MKNSIQLLYILTIVVITQSCSSSSEKKQELSEINYEIVNEIINYQKSLIGKSESFPNSNEIINYGEFLTIPQTTEILKLSKANGIAFGINSFLPTNTSFTNFFSINDTSIIGEQFQKKSKIKLDTTIIKTDYVSLNSTEKLDFKFKEKIMLDFNLDLIEISRPFIGLNGENAIIGLSFISGKYQIDKLIYITKNEKS